ncbi:hypothetical protein WOA01_00055 [Methylocystis sp. IM2]|uniref:hypothetical protein n=1 Tax=unclassified Methylocystis TaxID=2625913 RepID=UPI0030F5A688
MTPTWRAFANMSRAAARDPLWALGCIIFGPIRGGAYFAKALAMGTIVALVLLIGVQFVMETLRLKGSWLHRWADLGAGLVALAMIWRFATRPLIDHFGDMASDTHGSARFADKKEVRPLANAETGLLIGRDPESGALLRYDGPAHLLVIANCLRLSLFRMERSAPGGHPGRSGRSSDRHLLSRFAGYW